MKIETLSVTGQLEAFDSACVAQWDEIRHGSAKGSNAKVRTMDRLAAIWVDQDRLQEMLRPRLSQDDERLQCAAAAYLVKYEMDASAIAVLRYLASNSRTLVGSDAAALLRVYKIA